MTILLSPREKEFIQQHLTDNVPALLLHRHAAELDMQKLAGQLTARQKARHKLPTWYAQPDLVFPPALSVEQASSEQTATYKASLVSGGLLLDLTGGMGVDAAAFAQRIDKVIYVEQRADLADLARHNLPQLGISNVTVQTGNGLAAVEALTAPADWLYLDPHRRSEQGDRVVRLDDCEPDVTQPGRLATLLRHARRILLKTSPLIDLDAAVRQLNGLGSNAPEQPQVEAIHVVAVQGEVKEVLFVIGRTPVVAEPIPINAVNLLPDKTIAFRFTKEEEQASHVALGDPVRYVYEPNAAVLKAGAFRSVGQRFDLVKLAPHSHVYTSATLQPDFPGRIFALQHVLKPDRKSLQAVLPALKANLTVRNFPQSVAELRKKLSLREGGDVYILATTLRNGDKRLLLTTKVNGSG